MIIQKNTMQISFRISFNFIFDIFYLLGELILLYLLCCQGFAVKYTRPNLTQQSQLVNNPG